MTKTTTEPFEDQEEFKRFKQELSEEFLKYDVDKNSTISSEEFKLALKKLNISNINQKYFLEKIDKDQSNQITWDEYYDFGVKKYLKLKKIFDEFDENKDGKISFVEFTKILKGNKNSLDNEKLASLFKKFDENDDGFIDFFEWKKLLFFIPHVKDVQSVFQHEKEIVAIMNDQDFEVPFQTLEPIHEKSKFVSFLQSALSGALSGAITKTCIAPLERVKILKQIAKKGDANNKNLVNMLKDIYSTQGVKGLFKGNLAHILKSAPEKAVKFGLFETCKNSIKTFKNKDDLNSSEIFTAAAVSSGLAVLTLHPLEVIRTQLSVNPNIKTIRDITVHLINEGKRTKTNAFYRGLVPHLCSTVPNSGVNLLSYELLKNLAFGKNLDEEPSVHSLMALGGLSGVISSTIFYPFHLLKSRLIMKTETETLISILKDVKTNDGFKGFYKGFSISLFKTVPSHAISFGIYEFFKRVFGLKEKKKHSKIDL